MCFRLHLERIQGRWVTFKFLFFSQILFIIFPDFNKKHNRCVVCSKYLLKRGLFGPVTFKSTCTDEKYGSDSGKTNSKWPQLG